MSTPPNERPAGPWIALDVGDARIGVAASESGVIARTLPAIVARGKRARLDAVEAVAQELSARTLVVGLPVLEGGAEGAQAEKTRAFARSLARRMPAMAVVFWDERHTSSEARGLLEGRRGGEAPGRVDSVAAAVILQEFLDHTSGGSSRAPGG